METDTARTSSNGSPGRRAGQMPDKSPTQPPRTRVSPYHQRVRTPVRRSPSVHSQQARSPLRHSPTEQNPEEQQQLTLVVQSIVKSTIGQRDSSGVTLDDITVSGASLNEIITSLFQQLRSRIKGRAVKTDDVWSLQPAVVEEWSRSMQFRFKRHGVESTKSEEAWTQWVKSTRHQTVHLLIFEFGLAITKAQDLQESKATCIQPPQTDRSGAAAEVTLQDIVTQLQQHWADTFQGSAVVWRMLANHITRNLNRSTWIASISEPPPDYIVPMFYATKTYLEQHLARLNRSARMALDCVAAGIAKNDQFQRAHAVLSQRLAIQRSSLLARKEVIEALISEEPPPPRDILIDPLPAIENVADTEHEELPR